MKKFLTASVVLVIIAVCLYSCDKESAAPVLKDITGTWRYIGYSGGLAGFGFTPIDTLENYIQVDTASARIMFKSNNESECRTYTFEKNNDGSFSGVLTLNQPVYSETQIDVSLSHDTLTLYPHGWADAFASHYKISSAHFNWCADDNGVH